jgi:hypothetical protein
MGTGAGYLAARGYVGEIALAELLTRPALVYLASPFFGFGAGRPLPVTYLAGPPYASDRGR